MSGPVHLTEDGLKRCRATEGNCPLEHFESFEQGQEVVEQRLEEEHGLANAFNKAGKKNSAPQLVDLPELDSHEVVEEFSSESYYGNMPPRSVQLEALNGVVDDLERNDQTQLIAACGTGKTYMGRQLLNHMMSKEDSNGVGVVLTSSIKLASDTAADMRPKNGDEESYDHTFGTYGEDYEVIEVHSSARMVDNRQSVLENGVISTDRISKQISEALENDKKVVIVSTYDSCSKVQEAQSLFRNPDRARADVLMHDEAHNILGQQTPTSSSTDAVNSAYTGFADELPGAIQARKRLYATATPVIREAVDDKESTGTIENAREVAESMKNDRKARVTFYSTDESIVGGLGGVISQEEAIKAKCLAEPKYSMRDAVIADPSGIGSGYVNANGEVVAVDETSPKEPMTTATYSAVSSTLNAMAADPEPGKNPSHNALAYCGTIKQSEAFRDNFREVAIKQSGDMPLSEAEQKINDTDPETRRRARMRMLAEHTHTLAAHSRTDADSKSERQKAFKMFEGNSLTEEQASNGWTPNKRVLANVDIFSEGVSINEIDTVVMSDDDKCSERAMTQAIGRSIRTVPGNSYKTTGHVIIPRTVDESGSVLNAGSVAIASYGTTRVDRGVSTAKMQGQGIKEASTMMSTYSERGIYTGQASARDQARSQHAEVADIVTANEVEKTHINLMKEHSSYRTMSPSERDQVIRSTIREKTSSKNKSAALRAQKVDEHLKGKSRHEVESLRKSKKVLNSSIASGDVSSLSDPVASGFIKNGILSQSSGSSHDEPTVDEKREIVRKHSLALAGASATKPKTMSDEHKRVHERFMDDDLKTADVVKSVTGSLRGGEDSKASDFSNRFQNNLSDEGFVNDAYSMISTQSSRDSLPIFKSTKTSESIGCDVTELNDTVHQRKSADASKGESAYVFNPEFLRKNGDLNSKAINQLAVDAWDR